MERPKNPIPIYVLSACLLILPLGAGGCSCSKVVKIDSKPPGATIFMDGAEKGVTPSKVEIPCFSDPTQRVRIDIVKPDYKPAFTYWTLAEIPDETALFPLDPR